mmetsp:Transcript_2540/g.5530  ORF Transcript_2540/g.5530 Transcript_2540/m.5530 type:complete len:268 (-) Transcript_2540:2022-2825(-)
MDELGTKLADLLVLHHVCSSPEEAEVIAEIVLEWDGDGTSESNGDDDTDCVFSKKDMLVENLIENLDIEEEQAKFITLELERNSTNATSDNEESSIDYNKEKSSSSLEDNDIDEDDGVEYLEDGECELCDRYIQLTRHHLIPKSTWPRIQTKLFNAAEANERGDRKKALLILGPGLEDLLGDDDESSRGSVRYGRRLVLSSDKAVVRAIIHDTCDICRQCHSTVHRIYENMELALYYSTVEKLLEDEQVSKFCKWVSKQKTGKYSRS